MIGKVKKVKYISYLGVPFETAYEIIIKNRRENNSLILCRLKGIHNSDKKYPEKGDTLEFSINTNEKYDSFPEYEGIQSFRIIKKNCGLLESMLKKVLLFRKS